MLHIIPTFKRTLLVGTVFIMSGVTAPIAAFADTATPCAFPQNTTQAGVHKPVGADAGMYAYNCDDGMWENTHFTYNPNTGLTTANDPVVYTYNPNTSKYDTTSWIFNAPMTRYDPVTTSVAQPPSGAVVVGGPVTIAPAGNTIGNSGSGSTNTIDNNGGATNGSTINGTGPNSTNTIGGSNSNSLNENSLTNASITNHLTAQATTGSAAVLSNTLGGNATSGNAQDIANVVNLLQSTTNALSGNTLTFVANINGDVNGDLLLDPSILGTIQPAGATGSNNLTLNNQTNTAINNDINLSAQSGDATVANNTTGGNATSGSATAIANVVNVINSAINAGKSFVGVVNINGNLNGDILMPQNFLDQLIASNVPTVSIDTTGPSSTNTITGSTANNTTVNNTNNLGVNNTVNGQATTGAATVSHNTGAGNATSGNASNTSITAFNLTGSNVIGGNALLVFVNVSGKWVGMIVNAPAGATAAELGGGITSNTQDGSSNTTVNNTNNATINNRINLAAASGNASVTGNTGAGNATSGDAKTAANLLNIQGSHLTLANWFGILFINVFGNWNGSFGINTSAGDPVASASGGVGGSYGNNSNPTTISTPTPFHVFRFVPRTTGSATFAPSSSDTSATDVNASNTVLAAHVVKDTGASTAPQLQGSHNSIVKPAIIIGSLCALFIASDAFASYRKNRA